MGNGGECRVREEVYMVGYGVRFYRETVMESNGTSYHGQLESEQLLHRSTQ